MTADPLGPIVALVKAWAAAAAVCRQHAHDTSNGLIPTSRGVFAGRSDGYQNCADTLRLIIGVMRQPTEALQADLDAALAEIEKNIDPK